MTRRRPAPKPRYVFVPFPDENALGGMAFMIEARRARLYKTWHTLEPGSLTVTGHDQDLWRDRRIIANVRGLDVLPAEAELTIHDMPVASRLLELMLTQPLDEDIDIVPIMMELARVSSSLPYIDSVLARTDPKTVRDPHSVLFLRMSLPLSGSLPSWAPLRDRVAGSMAARGRPYRRIMRDLGP